MSLKIDCLSFVDNLAIISVSLGTAEKYINKLKTQAEKTDLQIYEETGLITKIKPAPIELNVEQENERRLTSPSNAKLKNNCTVIPLEAMHAEE